VLCKWSGKEARQVVLGLLTARLEVLALIIRE
jgi:hypothetical protein